MERLESSITSTSMRQITSLWLYVDLSSPQGRLIYIGRRCERLKVHMSNANPSKTSFVVIYSARPLETCDGSYQETLCHVVNTQCAAFSTYKVQRPVGCAHLLKHCMHVADLKSSMINDWVIWLLQLISYTTLFICDSHQHELVNLSNHLKLGVILPFKQIEVWYSRSPCHGV